MLQCNCIGRHAAVGKRGAKGDGLVGDPKRLRAASTAVASATPPRRLGLLGVRARARFRQRTHLPGLPGQPVKCKTYYLQQTTIHCELAKTSTCRIEKALPQHPKGRYELPTPQSGLAQGCRRTHVRGLRSGRHRSPGSAWGAGDGGPSSARTLDLRWTRVQLTCVLPCVRWRSSS